MSVYNNFTNRIIYNKFLNLCDKCLIICIFNSFCGCCMLNDTDKKNHKNSEDYDSHIIEIDEYNNV